MLQADKDKSEVQEYLNEMMKQPGAIGYVVINFDGKKLKAVRPQEEPFSLDSL